MCQLLTKNINFLILLYQSGSLPRKQMAYSQIIEDSLMKEYFIPVNVWLGSKEPAGDGAAPRDYQQ